MEDIVRYSEAIKMYKNTGIKVKVINEICEIARQNDVQKVYLFGSRARGDYKQRSNIDIAIIGGNYTRFTLDIEEYTSTLLKYDVVNMNGHVQQDLLDSIKKDGVTIYEKI